ncbi:MAG: hypothetical protein IJN74_04955, partial [Clostridia bacterium]|nr:hypothetical protein [Clostridia bacterium]
MKNLALFLALTLCLTLFVPFSVLAEEEIDPAKPIKIEAEVLKDNPERTIGVDSYQILENTSAEMLSGKSALYNWNWTSHMGRENTYLGCGFLDRSTDAHSGEYSVHINVGEGERCNLGPVGVTIPGETYEISAWFKRLGGGGDAHMEVRFSGKNKGKDQAYGIAKMSFSDINEKDGWVQKTVRVVAPPFATNVWVDLCFSGPGEILWDDVSMLCITNEMPKPEMPDKKPAVSNIEIIDPGFETGIPGEPVDSIHGWNFLGDAVLSDAYAHEGGISVELKTVDGGSDAMGIRYLTNLEEGATYQVSSWLMNPTELKIDMGYWMHWCSEPNYTADATKQLGQEKPRWNIEPNRTWVEYRADFEVPKGAKSAMLYFRHRTTPGSVYMDDVSIYMIKPPAVVRAKTDEVFYYTEWETGKVEVEPLYIIGDASLTRAEFEITNESGKKVFDGSVSDLSTPKTLEFPTSIMEVKGEQYNVNMKVYCEGNTLYQEENFPIFRYDRPTYLGADGIFRKNGKEIPFIMGNGLNMNVLDKHPEEGGITVAQLIADSPNLGLEQKERMDAYYEQGIFVVLNCYSGGKTAGHPDQIEGTKRTAETFKDHPALLGYKIADEPYQRGISDEEMIAGYKAIRDIDPNHPIYTDDSPLGSYEWIFRYCDIFECDYYSGSPYTQTTVMEEVQKASGGKKPYGILVQFFQQNGYFPAFDELRHMTYQGFFAGAYGYSYHTLGLEHTDGNTVIGLEKPQWKDVLDKWAPWEKDFALSCFVTGENKFVNYQKTEDYIWGTFTDGTDLYAITLNRTKDKTVHVDVPLQDGTGILKVDAFTAEAVAGKTGTVSGNGTLSLELAPWEASVWKVTSSAPLAVDHLKDTSFNDIITYP